MDKQAIVDRPSGFPNKTGDAPLRAACNELSAFVKSPEGSSQDFKMADRFLNILSSSAEEAVTFQFFSDKNKKDRRAAVHKHMKRPLTYGFHRIKQNKGCGVYVMVNRGDGKGRAAKNVIEVRALFIDLDGSPMEPAAQLLKPHVIVESSPGRHHLYWLVSDCTLEQFKPLQQAIAIKFDGDKSCCDLSRVLRVPGFYHLKKTPFLTRLVEANEFPAYTVQQIKIGLKLSSDESTTSTTPQRNRIEALAPKAIGYIFEFTDPKSGEILNLTSWAVKNPLFNIVDALAPQYFSGEIIDGKQPIQCPFGDQHTDKNPDLATFIVNADPPKYPAFDIHCLHAHCEGRDRLHFLAAMLKNGMLSPEILQTQLMKRPSYANYPAQEIAELRQLRSLNHDEFRILLNIMHLSLLEDDGTLPNNDWLLARSLGLNEKEWLVYKDTLIRMEWLIIADNQLFSPIFRREFIKSQKAKANWAKNGGKGGKISAANRAKAKASAA